MKKTLSYLGFAKKAGRLFSGADTCRARMRRGGAGLLIITEDTSPGSIDEAVREAERSGTPWRIYGLSDEVSHITGTRNRHLFVITDAGFAKAISDAIDAENALRVTDKKDKTDKKCESDEEVPV